MKLENVFSSESYTGVSDPRSVKRTREGPARDLRPKAGGDNLTVRHEARVIFGPQNEALQMGYGAGNTDRPASPKVPIKKVKLENVFLLKVTLCIKYALEALQSFARN